MTQNSVEIRYSEHIQNQYLATAERASRIVSIAGVVASVIIVAIALLFMEGLVRWILIGLAVIDMPIFLWYLPKTMAKPRAGMKDLYSRGGLLFTMRSDGLLRPQPRIGEKLVPWSEVTMTRYQAPENEHNRNQERPAFLRATVGDEEIQVIDKALELPINEVIDAEQSLRS